MPYIYELGSSHRLRTKYGRTSDGRRLATNISSIFFLLVINMLVCIMKDCEWSNKTSYHSNRGKKGHIQTMYFCCSPNFSFIWQYYNVVFFVSNDYKSHGKTSVDKGNLLNFSEKGRVKFFESKVHIYHESVLSGENISSKDDRSNSLFTPCDAQIIRQLYGSASFQRTN